MANAPAAKAEPGKSFYDLASGAASSAWRGTTNAFRTRSPLELFPIYMLEPNAGDKVENCNVVPMSNASLTEMFKIDLDDIYNAPLTTIEKLRNVRDIGHRQNLSMAHIRAGQYYALTGILPLITTVTKLQPNGQFLYKDTQGKISAAEMKHFRENVANQCFRSKHWITALYDIMPGIATQMQAYATKLHRTDDQLRKALEVVPQKLSPGQHLDLQRQLSNHKFYGYLLVLPSLKKFYNKHMGLPAIFKTKVKKEASQITDNPTYEGPNAGENSEFLSATPLGNSLQDEV